MIIDTSWLESEEFYNLVQNYRHADIIRQDYVIAEFDSIKKYIRLQISFAQEWKKDTFSDGTPVEIYEEMAEQYAKNTPDTNN